MPKRKNDDTTVPPITASVEDAMKKQSRTTGLVLTFLGSMVLLSGLDQPRVAALHVPDIVRLVAGGAGLGMGLLGLIGRLNMSGSANSTKD